MRWCVHHDPRHIEWDSDARGERRQEEQRPILPALRPPQPQSVRIRKQPLDDKTLARGEPLADSALNPSLAAPVDPGPKEPTHLQCLKRRRRWRRRKVHPASEEILLNPAFGYGWFQAERGISFGPLPDGGDGEITLDLE